MEIRRGQGYLPHSLQRVVGIVYKEVSLPFPVGYTYVGNGVLAQGIRPSPRANPFLHLEGDGRPPAVQFEGYASQRADCIQWIAPLSGQALLAEPGPQGVHAAVLAA